MNRQTINLHRVLLQQCIAHCLSLLQNQGFRACVHFELEGLATMPRGQELPYQVVNDWLRARQIPGQLKKEYWQGQWEYVSDFAGQSPLEEAVSLANVMALLPAKLRSMGAQQVCLSPVAWYASAHRYTHGSGSIFGNKNGAVHVPNAIQVNVSVNDAHGKNLMPDSGLGEWLQYHLLQNSVHCGLLFLPEEDAYRRLALRTDYGLDAELSSPWELSGGHQGSIALYKEKGKHNQPMGVKPLVLDAKQSPIASIHDWRATCRVEHRLGATSEHYDPFINVLFVLLNVLDAIASWQKAQVVPEFSATPLPTSLMSNSEHTGAIALFQQDIWFAARIDHYCQDLTSASVSSPGQMIKHTFLQGFRPEILSTMPA